MYFSMRSSTARGDFGAPRAAVSRPGVVLAHLPDRLADALEELLPRQVGVGPGGGDDRLVEGAQQQVVAILDVAVETGMSDPEPAGDRRHTECGDSVVKRSLRDDVNGECPRAPWLTVHRVIILRVRVQCRMFCDAGRTARPEARSGFPGAIG